MKSVQPVFKPSATSCRPVNSRFLHLPRTSLGMRSLPTSQTSSLSRLRTAPWRNLTSAPADSTTQDFSTSSTLLPITPRSRTSSSSTTSSLKISSLSFCKLWTRTRLWSRSRCREIDYLTHVCPKSRKSRPETRGWSRSRSQINWKLRSTDWGTSIRS